MIKQLCISLALIVSLKAYTQSNRTTLKPSGKINGVEKNIRLLKVKELPFVEQLPNQVNEDSNLVLKEAATTTSINWSLLCGSMNVYGMLSNQTRPLQYNPALNAVSFIHRKSDTYTPSPAANGNPGTIVAEISANWGQTWDSTCIWADATNGGRYPQGAIYNPPGNTNLSNAYVVGCGPVVSNNAFTGNWYASKQLGLPGSAAFNPTPATVSGAQQFLPFTQTVFPANQLAHGWSMQGFTSIDGGVVRSLALTSIDNADLNTMQGAMLVKGTFNAGVFAWTTDPLIPDVIVKSDGNKQFSTKVQMAWNEVGTVGYVVIIGALNSAIGSNRGLQPIIYKTSNSGQSWALCNGINFNIATYSNVIAPIAGVESDSTLKIPFVDDFDLVVDKNNALHIGAILASTFSDRDDSLQFISQFTTSINPNDEYKWKHIPGNRPYLYDFVGDGTLPWKYWVIDTLASEGPGSVAGQSGLSDNPWDLQSGDKIPVDPRLQLGRTPSGDYITFSWAETDSSFVSQSKKWNIAPNIKTRSFNVSLIPFGNAAISLNKINISKPNSSEGIQNPKVVNRATLHYMSPLSSIPVTLNLGYCYDTGSAFTSTYKIPFTVTNSNPYSQLTNNATWYTTAQVTFTFCSGIPGGMNENSKYSFNNGILFPNPATNSTNIKFDALNNLQGEFRISNLVGKEISFKKFEVLIGENNIEIDLKNIPSGVYFVNVKMGEQSFTKKLVIE